MFSKRLLAIISKYKEHSLHAAPSQRSLNIIIYVTVRMRKLLKLLIFNIISSADCYIKVIVITDILTFIVLYNRRVRMNWTFCLFAGTARLRQLHCNCHWNCQRRVHTDWRREDKCSQLEPHQTILSCRCTRESRIPHHPHNWWLYLWGVALRPFARFWGLQCLRIRRHEQKYVNTLHLQQTANEKVVMKVNQRIAVMCIRDSFAIRIIFIDSNCYSFYFSLFLSYFLSSFFVEWTVMRGWNNGLQR